MSVAVWGAVKFSAWIFLMSVAMPGQVQLMLCDQSVKIVGESTQSFKDHRPTILDDIKFNAEATDWDRERVAELLTWSQFCWTRDGCVVNGKYDPPPPPMKCPPGAPTS